MLLAGTVISIPDANLEAAIRTALDKPSGQITDLDMAGLTALHAGGRDIVNLAGLEYATNLQWLHLGAYYDEVVDDNLYNRISDIGPLAGLVNLTHLWLNDNQIGDLSPLGELNSLKFLNLEYNQSSDLSPLAHLTSLTSLDVESNQVDDLQPLAGLTNLEQLRLDKNLISDLSPLTNLANLAYLDLSTNEISDIAPLAGLTNLTTLWLYNNCLDVTPGSAAMTVIETLEARGVDVDYLPQLDPPSLWVNDDSGLADDRAVKLFAGPGSSSPTATFTLSNLWEWGQRLQISGLTLGGADAGEFALTVKDPAGNVVTEPTFSIQGNSWYEDYSYTLEVVFSPASLGEKSAQITFNTNDPDAASVVLSLSGKGMVATPITIPDANLEAAIRETLKMPAAPITDADMACLTSLTARGRGIQSLLGLEHAANLLWLNLSDGYDQESGQWAYNQVVDLQPLAELTNLTELRLGGNQISDLTPLAHLENLLYLNLYHNQIRDITPLAGLARLQDLSLTENQVSDISPLAHLENLLYLNLYHNQIRDITPLAGLARLQDLSLTENQVSDISPLAGLANLVEISLYRNRVDNLAPLAAMTNLTSISLGYNWITDISPLAGLTHLQALYLDSNGISDITPLAGLANLRDLTLDFNQISDVRPLAGLTNLQYLRLGYAAEGWGNQHNLVSDISPLASLTKLEILDLTGNQISDISALTALTSLYGLDLGGNRISNVQALAQFTGLDWLDLTGNQLQDISPLIELPQLSWLGLRYNYLDLTPDSQAMQVINALEQAGALVDYVPQNLAINGSSADDAFVLRMNAGRVEVYQTGDPPGQPSYTFPSGQPVYVLTLNGMGGDDRLTIDLSGGNPLDAINGLSIESGSINLEIANGPQTLRMGRLWIGTNASLNLSGTTLILTNEPEWLIAGYASDRRLFAAGNGGAFAGLSVVENDNGDGTPIVSGINGVAANLGDVIATYTWTGDANLDGVVNADDYFLIDTGFITQKQGWFHGDFNYDQVINADDYFLIDSAFIAQTGPLAPGQQREMLTALARQSMTPCNAAVPTGLGLFAARDLLEAGSSPIV